MIPAGRRRLQWIPGTPVTWSGEPWPIRNPGLWEAKAGDIFAGNMDLLADCVSCNRRGVVVDPALIARRYEPVHPLKDFHEKIRCRSCGGQAIVSIRHRRPPAEIDRARRRPHISPDAVPRRSPQTPEMD